MVIINQLTSDDWQLILSALNSELNNGWMNEIFPKRLEKIKTLIKKIEQ